MRKIWPVLGAICDSVTESSRAKGQTEDVSEVCWQYVDSVPFTAHFRWCYSVLSLSFALPSGGADAVPPIQIFLSFFYFPNGRPASLCISQTPDETARIADRGSRVAEASFLNLGMAWPGSSVAGRPHTHLHSSK